MFLTACKTWEPYPNHKPLWVPVEEFDLAAMFEDKRSSYRETKTETAFVPATRIVDTIEWFKNPYLFAGRNAWTIILDFYFNKFGAENRQVYMNGPCKFYGIIDQISECP